ncbi:hypothetical protein ACFOZ0_33645 [Streptomyces yaanensis]|uniref:Uncharacterized protein n=1 Tax=Streptomyces yaanensis TaxID=1142239 RepID=A0ABV7SPT8_9ACTN|nr:hypothetical protein [Streptomyces sp. CGMCC 4.7035]WNC00355.1 hypothetical protein Q2K21_21065 [Streptomyces sp. CGMCC 4.7035]
MIATGGDPARVLPPTPPPVLGDGVLQRASDGGPRPDVGHITPQYRIRHNGETGLLDDITGGGFVVLADGDAALSELDSADREFLMRIGATVVPLHSPGTPDVAYLDVDDAYLPHMREHAHVAAVIRPDLYLFGAAATALELHHLIGQLRERLLLTPSVAT